MTNYYKKHIFFCCNQKAEGKKCCATADAEEMLDYMRQQLKQQDQIGPDKMRISKAGCLGRCEKGPCVVIYPQGDWYTYHDSDDIDRIIDKVLLHDQPLPDLRIDQE